MPKKTVETIIDSHNDYVIQVKGNQPTLFQSIKEAFESQPPLSSVTHDEQSRGRHEKRTVNVLGPPEEVTDEWKGLQRVLHVVRQGSRKGKDFLAHHYYISSLCSDDAEMFARGIRGHWSIENRLHWVKDVIQHEDDSGIKKGNGVETLSILKNMAINISRERGFDSIKGAKVRNEP